MEYGPIENQDCIRITQDPIPRVNTDPLPQRYSSFIAGHSSDSFKRQRLYDGVSQRLRDLGLRTREGLRWLPEDIRRSM